MTKVSYVIKKGNTEVFANASYSIAHEKYNELKKTGLYTLETIYTKVPEDTKGTISPKRLEMIRKRFCKGN